MGGSPSRHLPPPQAGFHSPSSNCTWWGTGTRRSCKRRGGVRRGEPPRRAPGGLWGVQGVGVCTGGLWGVRGGGYRGSGEATDPRLVQEHVAELQELLLALLGVHPAQHVHVQVAELGGRGGHGGGEGRVTAPPCAPHPPPKTPNLPPSSPPRYFTSAPAPASGEGGTERRGYLRGGGAPHRGDPPQGRRDPPRGCSDPPRPR